MQRIALLLPLLVAACGGQEPQNPSDDTASVGDDTGTTDDTGEAWVECLPDHGVMSASTTWTYGFSNANKQGAVVATVVAYDATANTFTIETDEGWSDSSSQSSGESFETAHYRCNGEGLYLLEIEKEYSSTVAGNTSRGDFHRVYDEPFFLRPNVAVLNDAWSSSYTGSETGSAGDGPIQGSVDSEVTTDNQLINGVYRSIGVQLTYDNGNLDHYYWQHEVGVTGTYTRRLSAYTP